ncbi:MAG TPA: transglutaminase-like domain-containing protein [Steroidobacteraceae bacterium]|nr:transglutaminase-like domain-containing protein [Steroidobacteraceae bacterium]
MHARITGAGVQGFLLACACVASAQAGETQRWQVVSANGIKVGHALVTRTVNDSNVTESERIEIHLGKTNRRVRYRMVVETESAPDGALRRVSREVQTSEGHSRVQARVVGDALEITHGLGRAQTTVRLPGLAQGLQADEAARKWLAAVGRGEGRDPLVYRSWDPVKLEVVDVELVRSSLATGDVDRRVRSSRGTTGSLLRADASGDIVLESMALGSFQLTRQDATEQQARARDQVFDHIAPLLQKSPYRIPSRDMQAKIRYRFESAGGDNPRTAIELPAGAGQRTWKDGAAIWLQVCANCPLDAAELAPDERRRALESTQWLESADPQIVRRALRVAGNRSDAARMRRLTEFVRGHMGNQFDMLGYGTALEALRSRRGDCTEFAVLLAALGRAAGVPTRIAIGRVYARHFEGHRHVFVPHAWVQAWTGTGWESFDAAIGSFDSTHLAFAVSYDGNPVNHYAGITLSRELMLTQAARVVPRKVAEN